MLHLPDAGVGRRAPVCYFRGAAYEPSRGNRPADVAAGRSRAHAAGDPAWLRHHPPSPDGPASGSGSATVTLVLAGLAAAAPLRAGETPLKLVGALLALAGMLEILHSARRVSPESRRSASRSGGFTLAMGLLVLVRAGPGRLRPRIPAGRVLPGRRASTAGRGSDRMAPRSGGPPRRAGHRRQPGRAPAPSSCCGTPPRRPGSWPSPPPPASSAPAGTWSPRPCTRSATPTRRSVRRWGSRTIPPCARPASASSTRSAGADPSTGAGSSPSSRRSSPSTSVAWRPTGPSSASWDRSWRSWATSSSRSSWPSASSGRREPGSAGSFDRSTPGLEQTRGREGLAAAVGRWAGCAAGSPGSLRLSIRARQGRYSLPFAIERALEVGLPVVAVFVATVPIWGMSWYFDTENWAAGIYNSWAEQRTDAWRVEMIRAVRATTPAGQTESFDVRPSGLAGDWSFLVIGDPGEGDASQRALGHQILRVGGGADVRFMVISSDVVYPTGAMRNYETNFWLPFQGFERPVYAIPGNHDWYDALEAFAATFLDADAARATMRARVEADHRLTSTTESRIERAPRAGRPPARRLPRAHRLPARAVLPGPGRALRADRRRHGRPPPDRPRPVGVAPHGARTGAREVHHGHPGAPVLCRRTRPGGRRRGLRGAASAPAGAPGRGRDGRRHPRPRAVRRAARDRRRRADHAPRGQRRRRRLPVLRDRPGLAGRAGDAGVGLLPEQGVRPRQDRPLHALVEVALLGVDQALRGVAVSPPSCSRPPSTTTWRRSSRASSRSAWSPRPAACGSSRTACTGGSAGPISRRRPGCGRRARAPTRRWSSRCRSRPPAPAR